MTQSPPTKTLAIFFPPGDSFRKIEASGQASLMIENNIIPFAKNFGKVWVFTYENEQVNLPKNCVLIPAPKHLHRYLYTIMLPLLHYKILHSVDVIRCFHISASVPAIIAHLLWNKKFAFNYGYDYPAFAKIEKKPLPYLLFTILKPLALKYAAGIIVKNKTLAINKKSTYIPNGVDTKKFSPLGQNQPAIPTILFVGRLEPQKNILTLIEAVSHIKTPLKLHIVGDGALRQAVIDMAKKRGVMIKLESQVDHDLLPKIYQHATIFILPSVKEGSPKVLLEAMSCGLPCIASDIPEHQEIITDHKNGLLVKPTVSMLTRAIKALLKNATLQHRLGKNARDTIVNRFNQTNLIAQEITLLQSL